MRIAVRGYTPEWASEQTGIPAADIRTLAREYASTQPAMIRVGVAIERHTGGGQTVRSVACLPALVGVWRRVGGGLVQMPAWAFPTNRRTHHELARPGTRVVNQFLLGRALTGQLGLDPPIAALMVWNSNPVVVCPEQDKVVVGLSREDLFTVVSDHFLTDTARYADLVLPATTQLEQHDIMWRNRRPAAALRATPRDGRRRLPAEPHLADLGHAPTFSDIRVEIEPA